MTYTDYELDAIAEALKACAQEGDTDEIDFIYGVLMEHRCSRNKKG